MEVRFGKTCPRVLQILQDNGFLLRGYLPCGGVKMGCEYSLWVSKETPRLSLRAGEMVSGLPSGGAEPVRVFFWTDRLNLGSPLSTESETQRRCRDAHIPRHLQGWESDRSQPDRPKDRRVFRAHPLLGGVPNRERGNRLGEKTLG